MNEVPPHKPLVSVCIPTYNAAAFLEPCLLSAVRQTHPSLEILVSDDGSSDETVNIVRQFQQQFPQIRLIQNIANGGMVNNWNRCIEQARGEWIKFLFQDDVLEPGCVEELLIACTSRGVKAGLCSRGFIIHADAPPHLQRFFKHSAPRAEQVFGKASFVSPQELAEGVKHHLTQNFLGEPTCYFFQKTFCLNTGLFRTDLKQVVDYEFILRLGLVEGLAFVPKPMAQFRVHGNSESSSNTKTDKAVRLRTVAAETGDALLLVSTYLHDPQFSLVKETVGAAVLENYLKHLYHSACKHKGEALVNEALHHIRSHHDHLRFRYNFFNYVYYRRRHKQWERSIKNQRSFGSTAS